MASAISAAAKEWKVSYHPIMVRRSSLDSATEWMTSLDPTIEWKPSYDPTMEWKPTYDPTTEWKPSYNPCQGH